jgi:hypothetical protein
MLRRRVDDRSCRLLVMLDAALVVMLDQLAQTTELVLQWRCRRQLLPGSKYAIESRSDMLEHGRRTGLTGAESGFQVSSVLLRGSQELR